MMPLIPNGKKPERHERWLTPLGVEAKPALPTILRARAGGRLGGLKGPATKRAMTVARRLVPLKGDE